MPGQHIKCPDKSSRTLPIHACYCIVKITISWKWGMIMNYAFTNGKILNGTKDMQIQEGLCILVQEGKITDIVPDTTDLHDYKIINLHGHYILPGLINMHVHLAGSGKPQKKQRDNEKLVNTIMGSSLIRAVAYNMVAGFAREELLSGVTTIRTVG